MSSDDSKPGVEALMVAYQQSEPEAATALVTQLSPPIFQFFLGQSRNRSEAEDLLQDFWLRIHKARATFRPGEPLMPWLGRWVLFTTLGLALGNRTSCGA